MPDTIHALSTNTSCESSEAEAVTDYHAEVLLHVVCRRQDDNRHEELREQSGILEYLIR